MTWKMRYLPPEVSNWQGRKDTPPLSAFFQIIKLCNLLQKMPRCDQPPTFAMIGFACDEGIRRNGGRIGAGEGPVNIRTMLAKLTLHQSTIRCYDVGDITCTDGDLEASQLALAEIVKLLLQLNITPIVLGGGHEVAWGHYQGIMHHHISSLGIINFDAHFDMRPLLANQTGSSGTPFLQIAEANIRQQHAFHYYCLGIQPAANMPLLFNTAKQYGVEFLLAEEIYLQPEKCNAFIDNLLQKNEKIYLSFCLDVLAAAYAPGVSAPQALGLTPWQVLPYIRKLAASGKIISYDIAELSPPHDIDYRTAKLAAQLVYEIITHHK